MATLNQSCDMNHVTECYYPTPDVTGNISCMTWV